MKAVRRSSTVSFGEYRGGVRDVREVVVRQELRNPQYCMRPDSVSVDPVTCDCLERVLRLWPAGEPGIKKTKGVQEMLGQMIYPKNLFVRDVRQRYTRHCETTQIETLWP